MIVYDYRLASLPEAARAFCDYAVKLTVNPQDMSEADVLKLKSVGYTDAQISLGVQVIGYFNYINRIADGLGVDAEDWMNPPPEVWMQKKADFRQQ